MRTSKPRKNGQYCGGRPFPIFCPACRKCNGTRPTHFYNSRGLCNICHKAERLVAHKSRWPNTPSMIAEKELRQLRKNPLKWLRNIMTDSHARTIPSHLIELECWRIVHVTACRWYGEAVYLNPIALEVTEDSVWSMPTSNADADIPAPIFQPNTRPKRKPRTRALSEKGALVRFILKPLVRLLRTGIPQLPPPTVLLHSGGWTACWVTSSELAVVLGGPQGQQPTSVSLVESESLSTDFPYDLDNFKVVWSVFQASQTQAVDTT